jgi:serine/threonine protein kinase/Tfp pilus assembly protein PilF
MSLQPGIRLGPYEILAPLGAGGMGEVWKARDTRLERLVAVKVLPEHLAKSPEALARFEREAKAVAALNHPNITGIFDVGRQDGAAYIVMELLEGETLRQRLGGGAIPWRRATDLAIQLAHGLAAAHAKGLVHRDLKPENLWITSDGHLKILDFGLAKQVQVPSQAGQSFLPTEALGMPTSTQDGMVLGTFGYMSPEQARGEAVGPGSDLFAFGVVFYEMLTGCRAFARATAADTLAAVLKEDPPGLDSAPGGLPPALDRTLRHCLEKRPEARFQSMRDLAFALESLSDGAAAYAPAAQDAAPSIAVLPFRDMSPGRDQDYFCEGLADELIHALTRIPDLRVASRTASFRFKENPGEVTAIAGQLRVSNILEGSVRKAGERLRISIQLISASEGFHLWSERYDRDLNDVFAIQDEITDQVVKALRLVLTDKDRRTPGRPPTQSIEAYECYLRGRQAIYGMSDGGSLEAIRMLRKAVELDPEYALAYAGLADASAYRYMYYGGRSEDLDQADQASRTALRLGPDYAECHASRGFFGSLSKRYDEADQEFRTALALNPKLYDANYLYARSCWAQGRLEESAKLFEVAEQLRPEDQSLPGMLANLYERLGRIPDMEAALRRCLAAAERNRAVAPLDPRPVYYGATALVRLGQREKGLRWAAEAMALGPKDTGVLYNLACFYAQAGEPEQALDCLDQAAQDGFVHWQWVEHDSDLDSLRALERFQDILDRMKVGR